ncbi:glycosyltransferase family 1 protein [Azoarcus sp. KH32C]|uniref:glycosyltransferase family 4 protein n=1 Tax=Azoarcus sp. KH32C TaxID=748247 RepID=UPI00023866A5|nr:glycosyltransferase family 1 protein [Azoarcus sp. KH32C]BAL22582.1 glycosyltransferase family protein [Azoarcus sp. KH32C]
MLIDVTRLADRFLQGRLPTGVDRVSLAYVKHFHDRAHALVRFGGRWAEMTHRDSQLIFNALLDGTTNRAGTLRRCVARGYASFWQRRHGTLLWNTGHTGLDQPEYVRAVKRRALRPLFFLHDLIPITHPEYCRPGEADKHHRRLDAMLSVGHGLLVNSDVTRDELFDYAERRRVAVPPCAVAPLAPARLPQPEERRPLEQPYFVILGTIEPRKNHLLLLQLWRHLVEVMGEDAPRLVVIGQRGWECEQVVDQLDRCEHLRDFVIEKARCTDVELATWLHHARALLFPSFAEGFGIPLVEALMLGVPVIASDLPVFREIAEDIPEYLDPIDGLGWKRMILDYVEPDSPRRRAQCERMTGYAPPTWDEHFTVVEELMKGLDAAR